MNGINCQTVKTWPPSST